MKNPVRHIEERMKWYPREDIAGISRRHEAKAIGFMAVMWGGLILGMGLGAAEATSYYIQNLATAPNPAADGTSRDAAVFGLEIGAAGTAASVTVLGVLGGVEFASLSVLSFHRAQDISMEIDEIKA